jgi:hypothetical protein
MGSNLLTFVIGICLLLPPAHFIQTAPDKNRGWRPGTYRGLTVGKSTRADMLRILGNPLSSGPSADQDPPRPIIWNDYGTISGELSGRLAVEFDSRNDRLVGITISPEQMTKDDAIRHFGSDYLLMGYEFCPDEAPDADVGVVYEAPKSSSLDYIEYRSRGIAIHLDSQGNVNAIYYVDKPLGLASKAACKRAVQQLKRRNPPRAKRGSHSPR